MAAAALLLYGAFVIQYGLYLVSSPPIDFPTFFGAAQLVFNWGVSPYDVALLSRVVESDQTVFPYLSPPQSVLLFYPYKFMSFTTAANVTLAENHFLVLLAAYLIIVKILRVEHRPALLLLSIAYIFLYHPIGVTLDRGQVNLLVLVLLCLSWYQLRRPGRPALAALPLALAGLIKTYPFLLIVFLIAGRRLRVAAWTVGFAALGVLLAYVALPQAMWMDWLTQVAAGAGYAEFPAGLFSPAAPFNQSINGFTSRLFLPNDFADPLLPSPMLARLVPYGLATIVIGATGIASYAARERSPEEKTDLEVPVWLLAVFLVAPFSWEHHLVFLIPAALIALRVSADASRLGVRHMLAVLSAVLLAWRLPVWAEALAQGAATLLISAKLYAVLLLWAFLWQELRKEEGVSC